MRALSALIVVALVVGVCPAYADGTIVEAPSYLPTDVDIIWDAGGVGIGLGAAAEAGAAAFGIGVEAAADSTAIGVAAEAAAESVAVGNIVTANGGGSAFGI